MSQAFDIAIDVSDFQPTIDWSRVYAAGIRIAMVKASEGATFASHHFSTQRSGAERAGIKVIPYHFLRSTGIDAQVQQFRRVAGLAKNQPFALDWEGRASQTCAPHLAEAVGVQLQTLTGRTPLGYWGIPGSTPAPPTAAMAAWDRWVPRYPKQGVKSWSEIAASPGAKLWARTWPGALFAQYTCWGAVPGIPGAVDRSAIFANSLAEALAWYATGQRPMAEKSPAPAATV